MPGGLTAVPNTDPRNIEWLYGRDPLGAITNTITGAVDIATLGNAPQASGRFSPVPGPGTLSQAITIPATCVAGQYFRVYLKNWNKCNWTDPEYVNTFVDINVIAAPPAPTVPNRTICFGDVRTLTVTSPPVGTINWYSDALLTTLVGTGVNYTPVQTAVGSYNFWVVDKSTTGLLCQSLATMVTLTINPIPNKPTVSVTGSLTFCFDGGITSVTLTANPNTPPAITSYQWYKNGGAIGGAVTNAITLNDPSQNGIYTVRTFGINPTNCPSPLSDPLTVTIYSISNIVDPTPQSICESGSTTFTVSSADPISQYSWEYSDDGGVTWKNVNNGINYNNANSQTLQLVNAPLTFNGNLYRGQLKTVAGGCWFHSNSAMLTVNQVATATNPANTGVCQGSPASFSITAGGGASTIQWQRSNNGGTTWTNITGAAVPNDGCTYSNYNSITLGIANTQNAMSTYQYRAVLTTISGSCVTNSGAGILTVYQLATTTNPPNRSICQGIGTTFGITAGGGARTINWERSSDGGTTWTSITGASIPNDGCTYSNYNTATLSIANSQDAMNNFRYHAVLTTTSGGCVTTSAAGRLTVYQLGTAIDPVNIGVCQGTAASFSITTGGGASNIQWQRSNDGGGTWTNITGAGTPADGCTYSNYTTTTLGIANTQNGMDTYQYRARLTTTSGACVTYSGAGVLTVYQLATTTNPANAGACQGTAASVAITPGGGASTIQWQRSSNGGTTWVNITGAANPNDGCTYSNYNTSTLGIANTQNAMNTYQYQAVLTAVSGNCVTTSGAATLTVYQLATTTNPANKSVCQGAGTSFSITAGGAARTIQWQRSSDGGTTWTSITGAATPNDGCTYSNYTTATIGITNAQNGMNNFQYHAVLTTVSGGCVTTSGAGILTVNLLPIPTISGPSAVCIGSVGNNYITEAGMTNYTWSISAGGTITGGGGVNQNKVVVEVE